MPEFQPVLFPYWYYKAVIILILPVIMEAFRSIIMEAFRDQFTATELLSYKEVVYEEAMEEWYAQLIQTK